jgi:hypothetical protein
MKPKCIICGTTNEIGVKLRRLPHGKIYLCSNDSCMKLLTYKLEGSVPIIWFGPGDLVNHDEFTQEEVDLFKDEDMIAAADEAADLIWNGDFGETFNEAVTFGAKHLEYVKLYDTPDDQLPLIDCESLKHAINKRFLMERLKGKPKEDALYTARHPKG